LFASKPVGVLALQGDFAEHLSVLERLGIAVIEVRKGSELDSVSGLIIPGGESTTILKLLDRFTLTDSLKRRIAEGMPVFGTCAGAIVLARETSDGEPPLGVLDIEVKRNAYGRQVDSFEAPVVVDGIGVIEGVFIRAPVITEVGDDVEVLATLDGVPVLVRQGAILASSFHPEMTDESYLHTYFVEMIEESH
jgi:5'-phosphate synthase pdxT subunit